MSISVDAVLELGTYHNNSSVTLMPTVLAVIIPSHTVTNCAVFLVSSLEDIMFIYLFFEGISSPGRFLLVAQTL